MMNKKEIKTDTPEEMVSIPRSTLEELERLIIAMADQYIESVRMALKLDVKG